MYVAPSGILSLEPMETLLKLTDVSRIMYSVDYPFARNDDGKRFMTSLRVSGLVMPAGFEAIASGNARRLLKL